MKTDINETLVNVPCSVTMPCKLELPDYIGMDGNRYEFHIYAGVKPVDIDKKPSGRLLCKVINKEPAPIIANGTASYFVIVRNKKEVAGYGNIGTSGCPMIISDTRLVKGDFFTIQNIW